MDENGQPLSEELTLPLAAEMMLSAGRVGPVVTNVSTTSAVERVASRHGATVIRTPVGQGVRAAVRREPAGWREGDDARRMVPASEARTQAEATQIGDDVLSHVRNWIAGPGSTRAS